VHLTFEEGSRMTVDKLLVIIPYLLRSCFAPTNIFAKVRCTLPHLFEKGYIRENLVNCNSEELSLIVIIPPGSESLIFCSFF
jgi:hypothetical protein